MAKLTEKEKEILKYLSEGLSNTQIADILGITKQAVQERLNVIYPKLGVENRIQAVMKWKERKKILTVREAAEMLRVHPNTIREWEREGKIKAYRLGGRGDRRFDLEEVERFLRRR